MKSMSLIQRAACAAVVVSCFAVGGASRAEAADVITACVASTGEIRIAADGAGCKKGETTLTWNSQGLTGPAGPSGAQGLTGLAGATGPEGPAGRDGRDGRDAAGTTTAPSRFTAQMRIDGVNGGAATPIATFSLGATDALSSTGIGKVTFSNLVVSKTLDGDSVPLLQAASTGRLLASLAIDVFDSGGAAPFATYTFDDVIVTSTVLGSATSVVNEQDAFDFRRITTDVTVNGQTFHSCFDVKALTSCS